MRNFVEDNGMNNDMRFKLALIVVVVLAFAMGSARTAYAAPPTDACTLLTRAQASAALGVPITNIMHVYGSKALCSWSHQNGLLLDKSVTAGIPAVSSEFPFEKKPAIYPGEAKTKASGIGDDAFYDARPAPQGTTLIVRKGNFAFSVRVYGIPAEQIRDKEKTLAQDILAKL